VANGGDDTVSRIDPVSGEVTATIEVGKGPFSIASGEGAVWVANRLQTSISRIDPSTNEVSDMDVGIVPESMAVGEGSIWIAYDRGFDVADVVIEKFDARTGQHVGDALVSGEEIRVAMGTGGTFPWAMAAGGGSLWAGGFSGRVIRIDAQTLKVVDQMNLDGKPINAIWLAGASVWVGANGTPGTVYGIDAESGDLVSTVPAGGGRVGSVNQPMSGAADEQEVWVTDTQSGSVSRIVILSEQASSPIEVGPVPTGIALGLGSIWVSVDGTSM
jgi:YVTN family beta-propeller protein